MTARLNPVLFAMSALVVTVTAAAANAQTVWHNDADKTQVLGVRAGNMNNGTQLISYQVTGWADQNWTMQNFNVGSADFQIWTAGAAAPGGPPPTNKQSRCLALPNGNTGDGTQLIIWDCTYHTTDQGWRPVFEGDNEDGASCFAFFSTKASTKVFSAAYLHPTNGDPVVLDTWGNLRRQVWCAYNPDGTAQHTE